MSDVDTFKVTMRNVSLTADGTVAEYEVVDYVPSDILDVYVADAKTRWAHVGVSDEPESNPNSDEAPVVPEHLAGKSVDDFAEYGDHTTPENALDQHLGS